ncbi:hypothetical protein Q8791_18610 [Nocardiopsis sp. CT-R113]|uniref:ABC transporter ATP-binding protein n=1 Tax=Nocardiopsis codii TaxID=3065942 RepID=A0ABU7KAF8_9ACTN|nr:hypothetical protein [Nocardiopsis sp. CT-R113]MEE2039231.1 hypothetical protein [Nocardiopsis sp. CT-R113]
MRGGTAAPERTTATRGATQNDGSDAGHRLRSPGRLHAFNRYELKYLVPVSQVAEVRAEPGARMTADRNAGTNGYADRICAVEDGAVVEFGTPDRIMTDEVLTRVFETPVTVMDGPNGPLAVHY